MVAAKSACSSCVGFCGPRPRRRQWVGRSGLGHNELLLLREGDDDGRSSGVTSCCCGRSLGMMSSCCGLLVALVEHDAAPRAELPLVPAAGEVGGQLLLR